MFFNKYGIKLLLFGLLSPISINLYSQTCSFMLSGVVIDEHDLNPISDVYISVSGKPDEVFFTNSSGYFEIPGLCADTLQLVFNHIGCEQVAKELVMSGNKHIDVKMEHHTEELEQFTVVGNKHEDVLQSIVTLSETSIRENIGMHLADQLATLNGVNKLNFGAHVAKPIVQGQHSNRLVIINNGIRQEGQQWGQDHAPAIGMTDVNSISVLKGASSVRYGANAIGGVILIEAAPLPLKPGVEGRVGTGFQTNGRTANGEVFLMQRFKKLPKLAYRFNGSYQKGGNTHTPDYYLDNTGIENWQVSTTIGWKQEHVDITYKQAVTNTTLGIFSGAHIGNLSDLEAAFQSETPKTPNVFSYDINRPFQKVYHEINHLKGKITTHKLGVFSWSLARQFNFRREYDKIERKKNVEPNLHLELTTWQADVEWLHPEKWGVHGLVGVSGIHQTNTYEGRAFIPNYVRNNIGIFWIEHKEIGAWRFDGGVRFEKENLDVYRIVDETIQAPSFEFQQVSYHAGVAVKAGKHSKWRARMANAWRPPHVSELYSQGIHHGSAAIENGNENLKKEQTNGLYLDWLFEKSAWKIELTAYRNHTQNYIYLQPNKNTELTIRGAFPSFTYEQADVVFTGSDAQVAYAWNKQQQTSLAIQYIHANQKGSALGVIGIPPNSLTMRHQVGFKLTDAWTGECWGSFNYVAEQYQVNDEQDFAPIPDSYALTNLGVKLMNKHHMFSIGVQNLLNVRYRNYLNRLRYYSDELGRAIQLTYQLKF